jgi:hypothetical protein
VIIYSCVATIYLIRFSDYIIDQHNGDDLPQSYETSNSTDRTWTDVFREQYAGYSVRNMAENIKKTATTSCEAKI